MKNRNYKELIDYTFNTLTNRSDVVVGLNIRNLVVVYLFCEFSVDFPSSIIIIFFFYFFFKHFFLR